MKEITKRSGRPLLPCEVFDLICGTSVGGLITILIGRLGLNCQDAINVYEAVVKKIFENNGKIWKNIANGQFLNTSEFDTYMAQKVGEIVGSPDVSMRLPLKDGQDPRYHPSTKTFVTLMEDEPEYPSCTHMVSSYKREPLVATATRHWTIPEVTRATIASPIYLSPFSVNTDKIRSFQDAGFGGYNNPIHFASVEWQKIWPNERVGSVISLGTGLRDFLPETLPKSRVWGPVPQYVNKIASEAFEERLSDIQKSTNIETNVKYAIRQLTRIAADSSISHQHFDRNFTSLCDHYYRIDEPFGLNRLDLVDVFQADLVRRQVDDWLKNKKQYIEKLVDNLGVEGPPPPPVTKEAAHTMKPPPPPTGTVKGYNPIMDQPRPTEIKSYLRNYEVLFIIDDSGSMHDLGSMQRSRWIEARDALLEIAQYALDLKVRSVNLRFLNNSAYDRGLQGTEALMSRFDSVIPDGGTPTGAVLDIVLTEHLDRIDRTVPDHTEYSKIPPLDIIVLTDGVPTDDPADVIAKAVKRLNGSRYHPNTMGIQFIQIGNEKDAKAVLKGLVKGDNGSIVDTVPYKGALTSQELQRIVLNGLHPNVRAMVPDDWLAVG
ncbi:hypothetical protein APHAL10511_000526 [Amanita phalloides]|nr:hypothetical protein APHAL10511_000526 [Amanita phalloides]